MKRYLLLIIVILLLAIGGWYAYTLYSGKVQPLTSIKAEENATAADLMAAFEKDSAMANKKFLGKVVEVSGRVKLVEREEGAATVVLGDDASMSSVRCSMDTAAIQQAVKIQAGTNIIIKGVCTGFNADELVGSDVILNRCVLTENKK